MTEAWRQYEADFNSMNDRQIRRETEDALRQLELA